MAVASAQVAPEVMPQTGGVDRYQRFDTSTVANPGIGGGLIALGQGATQAGDFFGQAAADQAYNDFEEGTQKILNGDPTKKTLGPNGEVVLDTGYMGLKGRNALDAREATVKAIDGLRDKLRGNLTSMKQDQTFDRISRRYTAIIDGQVGAHARTQANVYASNVNSASSKLALDKIAGNANDPALMEEGLQELTRARVRQAELNGGGPELILEAERGARRDGLSTHIQSIATEDPARALRMIERNKEALGVNYDNLFNATRARADQQVGQETADRIIGGGTSLKAGDDTLGVIRHFEGFRNTAYEDRSPGAPTAWRVGYGSDTVTREDGRVEKVTKDTVVSKEDAERDLVRRANLSQEDARKAIGAAAWDKLDGRAKASLTSIAYNYGTLSKPELAAVREAAKSGDPEKLAATITALGTHNGGINARRRAIEGANVKGQVGPEGRDSLPDQASVMDAIENDPGLTPQAKAAAIAQANRTYQTSINANNKNKVAFESQVADNAAEAWKTGDVLNPIPESRFVKQYGPSVGPVKYQEHMNEVEFGAKKNAFETMPNVQIQQTINTEEARTLVPGSPGYANQTKKIEQLRKYADALQKQRLEDPSGVVSRMPYVQEALKQYDPKNPKTFQAVVRARMEAQETLGIPPENRSPITKRDALDAMNPYVAALPGKEMDEMEKIAVKFRDQYGENAPRAVAYALRAVHANEKMKLDAAALIGSLTDGTPITPSEKRAAQDRKDTEAIARALATEGNRPEPEWMRTMVDPSGFGGPMSVPNVTQYPMPQSDDILRVVRQPGYAADFDKKYGPGKAKEMQEKFGATQKKRAN